jgi:hypothetical protein
VSDASPSDTDVLREFLCRLGQACIGCGKQTAQNGTISGAVKAASRNRPLLALPLPVVE